MLYGVHTSVRGVVRSRRGADLSGIRFEIMARNNPSHCVVLIKRVVGFPVVNRTPSIACFAKHQARPPCSPQAPQTCASTFRDAG